MLTQEQAKQRVLYDKETGLFHRLAEVKPLGRVATNGYLQICVNGKRYMAHRLAWLITYGEWPDGQLDHINQDKLDNRIANLRVVTNKQNGENVRIFKHNKSGFRGVSKRADGKWIADIKQHGKTIHLGVFSCVFDAARARAEAEKVYFTHAPDYPQISPCRGKVITFQHGSRPAPGTNHIVCDCYK